MSTPLIILGTGVHAAEMAEMVERVNGSAPVWELLGLLSDKDPLPAEAYGLPVLGAAALEEYPEAALAPAFGWPRALGVLRERLVSLVDPSCFVSRTAALGAGCVLFPHCCVGLNARLGEEVFCLSGSILNHDNVLEDRVVVASGV